MSDVKGILFDVGGTLIKEGGGELLPSVVSTLSILRSSYKLGIVTNTDIKTERDIRDILRKFGVEGYFDTVVVSRDVGYRKPDGRIFHIALDRLGLQPEEAIMVGNKADVDVKGGKAVGMKTVLITWHNESTQEPLSEEEKPTYIISSMEELLAVI